MWQPLGAGARDLAPARRQLHWAAQVLGAAADAYGTPAPDDSHTAMAWDDGTLVGTVGVALRIAAFELRCRREILTLHGRTLAEAMTWTDARLADGGTQRAFRARTYDMPADPVGTAGARFDPDPAQLAELARYYANGVELFARHAPLAVWPHHFDLGGIIYVGAGQLGIGLSPGDDNYAAPYLYVTPYPVPGGAQFPALAAGGEWSTHFTGAVLTDLAGAGETGAHAFVDAALAAGRALIA